MLTADDILDNIREKPDTLIWTKHALDKCDIYGFDEEIVLKEVIEIGECIQFHYWHGFGEKIYLFVESEVNDKYQVVVVHDQRTDKIIVKTVYRPDGRFDDDGKTISNPNRAL